MESIVANMLEAEALEFSIARGLLYLPGAQMC